MFLNSEIYIVHVINHEWNRSMFVASAVCFVWDIKLYFPTLSTSQGFGNREVGVEENHNGLCRVLWVWQSLTLKGCG